MEPYTEWARFLNDRMARRQQTQITIPPTRTTRSQSRQERPASISNLHVKVGAASDMRNGHVAITADHNLFELSARLTPSLDTEHVNSKSVAAAIPTRDPQQKLAADSAMSNALAIPKRLMRRVRARLRSWTTRRHKRTTNPCPLLKLPPELRLLIYDFVYDDVYCGLEITRDLRLIRVYYGNGDVPLGEELPRLTALLTTCKLICQEAAPVLAQRTIFCIHRLPHLHELSVSRRLMVPGSASAMLEYMRRGVCPTWARYVVERTVPQAEKLLGHAMASSSIIRSAQRVVLCFSAFDGNDVNNVVTLITNLISVFNAHENGLIECGIELSSASSSLGNGDPVLRAFNTIKCQKKVQVMQRLWLTDYYSDQEWENMLERLDAVEVKSRRVGAFMRGTA